MRTDLELRSATKHDINEIVELSKKLIDYHSKLDKFNKSSSEIVVNLKKYITEEIGKRTRKFIVVQVNDKIVGYFSAKIEKAQYYEYPTKVGVISQTYLEKKYRGQNIGKTAVKELIKWMREKNVKHIMLNVNAKNGLAEKFWKSFKFKEYRKQLRLDL